MKMLIIGATRGIGARLLEQALAQGHSVTVLARDPGAIPMRENLRVVPGSILDSSSVATAVQGQDAVCITIGLPPTRKPVFVFSEGAKNVISAMKRSGVARLVCVTGIGAGDSKGHGGFLYDRIFNPLLLSTIYADKNIQEGLVRDSGLEWLIVRPGFLTNGPLTGQYRVLTDLSGVKSGKISRADVAHFILTQLNKGSWSACAPLLTY